MLTDEAIRNLVQLIRGHHPVMTPPDLGCAELVSLPSGMKIESLESFQSAPNAIRQKVSLYSCASFCEYVNRFKQDGSTVYLNVDGGSFVAVLDHDEPDAPAWRAHKATFAPKKSLEWMAWMSIHKKSITQVELAHHIEERLDDISVPEPNVMLQAALEFQSNERLALASSTNLDNGGTRFTFKKDNVAKSVEFPHRIKIRIPVFENEDMIEMDARVRYRTDGDGVLQFSFSFVRDPSTILRSALVSLADEIRAETAGLHHYEGGA